MIFLTTKSEKSESVIVRGIKFVYKRYLIDAMSSMALGLFSSLIIGLIISQFGKIPALSFLTEISSVLGASSPVVGAAIGGAIAYGLKGKPLVVFSCIAVGALGYQAGGPVGAYLAAIVGAEIGSLVASKTPVDIIVTPIVTIVSGGLIGLWVGPPINSFMQWFGSVINYATELSPLPMGIIVAVLVGLALTAPISSAAICIMMGIDGLAAGAAVVGCSCQMIGFAVASFRDNGVGGLIAQGLGTSMLQISNILKKPQILIAPTVAGAILGPISTCLFKMTNTPSGAGMGTSGLVGQFGAFSAMSETFSPTMLWASVILMHFILPAIITLVIDGVLRKAGLIKKGDMKLELAK